MVDHINMFSQLVTVIHTYGYYAATAAIIFLFVLKEIFSTRQLVKIIIGNQNRQHPTPDKFHGLINANSFILGTLNYCLEDIGASRILITLYHNGGKALNGLDFTKMSCSHEVLRNHGPKGKRMQKTVQKRLINLPVTAFAQLTQRVFDEQFFVLDKMSELKRSALSVYEELKEHNSKSAVVSALTDIDGEIYGFMIVEFSTHIKQFSMETLKKIKMCSERISAVLENAKQEK